MKAGSVKRWGAILLGLAVLLAILAARALLLPDRRSGPEQDRIFQDVPAIARLRRSVSLPAARATPPERTDDGSSRAEDAGSAGNAFALEKEARSNREAILDIDGTLRDADVGADKLRSQVARQDDTIAAQRQALQTGQATDADRSDAQAALTAAIEVNEGARASLARYETTRSALLERKTALEHRNAKIASRLKR